MKIATFVRKYNGRTLEDWGAYPSDEFKQFARDMKSTVKEICKEENAELVGFSVGHYYVSGFVVKNGNHVYFSYDPRWKGIDFSAENCRDGILVRTAKHEKDFTGGMNNFCNIYRFSEMLNRLTK